MGLGPRQFVSAPISNTADECASHTKVVLGNIFQTHIHARRDVSHAKQYTHIRAHIYVFGFVACLHLRVFLSSIDIHVVPRGESESHYWAQDFEAMNSAPANPPRHDAPLGRDEAEWMIQEMDWIPSDFPNTGTTALMRIRFSEAVAAFSLQLAVDNVVQRRSAAPVLPLGAGPGPKQSRADVGADPRVNPTEAEEERVEVRSHPST